MDFYSILDWISSDWIPMWIERRWKSERLVCLYVRICLCEYVFTFSAGTIHSLVYCSARTRHRHRSHNTQNRLNANDERIQSETQQRPYTARARKNRLIFDRFYYFVQCLRFGFKLVDFKVHTNGVRARRNVGIELKERKGKRFQFAKKTSFFFQKKK